MFVCESIGGALVLLSYVRFHSCCRCVLVRWGSPGRWWLLWRATGRPARGLMLAGRLTGPSGCWWSGCTLGGRLDRPGRGLGGCSRWGNNLCRCSRWCNNNLYRCSRWCSYVLSGCSYMLGGYGCNYMLGGCGNDMLRWCVLSTWCVPWVLVLLT